MEVTKNNNVNSNQSRSRDSMKSGASKSNSAKTDDVDSTKGAVSVFF